MHPLGILISALLMLASLASVPPAQAQKSGTITALRTQPAMS
jgi:hypothetical protein